MEKKYFPARMFLHTFTRGDGCVRKRKNGVVEWVIYSSTLDLAGDLQELIQKAGWSSSLRTQYGQTSYLDGREIVSSDGYIVTVKRRASRAEVTAVPKTFSILAAEPLAAEPEGVEAPPC